MDIRSVMRPVAAVALTLLIPVGGVAAEPPSITGQTTQAELVQEERDRIAAYAEYWAEQLSQANGPEELRRAKRRLLNPLRVPGVRDVFLDVYGRALIPALRPAIDEGDSLVSVNAIIVISQIGTDRALEALARRCSPRDEPRLHARLTAARGCKSVLRRLAAETQPRRLVAQSVMGGARRLRDAARAESDEHTLRHQLESILAADLPALSASQSRQVRTYLVEALQSVAQRAAAAGADSSEGRLFTVAYEILDGLFEPYLQLPEDAATTFGLNLGPCLGQLIYVPVVHWDAAHQPDERRERYAGILSQCERLLKLVLGRVHGTSTSAPNTELKGAWDAGDRERFERDVNAWRAILDQPPFEPIP